jgi:hemolysin III
VRVSELPEVPYWGVVVRSLLAATGLRGNLRLARLPEGERANIVTHGIASMLSTIGAVVLIRQASATGDPWRIAGCAVFATALIMVYAASTLSHAFVQPDLRRFFRMLDQGTIYIFIVGTYTPFALTYLRTPAWWAFLALMWGIALHGLFSKLWQAHRVDAVLLGPYLLLGWMPVVPFFFLVSTLPLASTAWVLAGGLCYTFGTIFFALDNKRFHCHAIWHSFVMAGSLCHFWAIYSLVASPPSLAA